MKRNVIIRLTLPKLYKTIRGQYHSTVLGKNHANLNQIMEYTNCKIIFPDAQDPYISHFEKSKVNISGNIIKDVYKARELVIGSLPLIIIFDLPKDKSTWTNQQKISKIETCCDVTITLHIKDKENGWSVVIKGVEKNAGNIYKARNCILGIEEICMEA